MDTRTARQIGNAAASEAVRRATRDDRLRGRMAERTPVWESCLRDLLAEVLVADVAPVPERLLLLCRQSRLSRDAFDALGHHLLSALLPHRVGADALIRVGALLGTVRGRLHPAGPARNGRRVTTGAPAGNAAARRYTASRPPEHLPTPPGWFCTGCGAAWPCPTKQSQLLVEFGGASAGLAVYLGACLVAAVQDLPALSLAQARERFLGWLPRTRF
ncbi:hypothetical protein [Micromonospora sp. HK10]|uniref:hypothetical protein n=1 Tax=Micromonospora sp. HK10 TaxID=1538294 RepID=UPI000A59689F|nr:hypothetical protein [Micromonospora sp. HK10]